MKYVSRSCAWLLLLVAVSAECAKPNPEKLVKYEWLEVRSSNFHVITDAKEKIARKMVQDLENFRFFISMILNIDLLEGVRPVSILAVYNRSNFRNLGLHPNWAGIFYQSVDGAYAVANIRRYETDSDETNFSKHVLMHEYVHYVTHNTFSQVFYPPWHSEGMAEYLATFRHTDNEIILGELDGIVRRFDSLEFVGGKFRNINIENLFKTRSLDIVTKNEPERMEFERFYARALSVVHFLNSSAENQKMMNSYIRLLNEGQNVDTAFKASFARSYQDLEREVVEYISRNEILVHKIPVSAGFKFPLVEMKVAVLGNSDFYYYLADFLRVADITSFEQLLSFIKKSLDTDPANADKKILMADILFKNGIYGESRNIAMEILEKNPRHTAALALYGDHLLREAGLRRAVGLGAWEQTLNMAQNQYRKAIKSDALNARAYRGLGISHTLEMNDALLQEGAVALESARFFKIDPDLLWDEILLRLRMHDNESVIPLLRQYVNMGEKGNFGVGRYLLDIQELRLLPEMQVQYQDSDIYIYSDGSVYRGGWKEGRPDGNGVLTRLNGVGYTGLWKKGLIHGKGEFSSSERYRFLMLFKNGEATGVGELQYPGGDSYKGELLNGMIHGKGEINYVYAGKPNGKYIGNFWLNLKNGPGVFYGTDDTSVKHDCVFGNRKIALSEELTYVGGIDEKGLPNGWGQCVYRKNGAFDKIESCSYTSGVINKPDQVTVR